jgi:altronate dehydratase small subunit
MNEVWNNVMMKPKDSVAVALMDIPAGSAVEVSCQGLRMTIELKESIQFGHKFAVTEIKKGDHIMKYGEVIGGATRDIEPGEHVHIHNLEGLRGRGDKLERV